MLYVLFGIFVILHGLVHLLYAGQSWGFYELRPEMSWPAAAWLFAKWWGSESIRLVASGVLVLTTLGFVIGGLGLICEVGWWRNVTMVTALFSSLLFFALWNGKFQALPDQGAIGILINLGILGLLLAT